MINQPAKITLCCIICCNEFSIEKDGFIDCPHCKNWKYVKFTPFNDVEAQTEADKKLSSVLMELK